jgi:hypothetical protein
VPNNEEDNDKLLNQYGKMAAKLCGKPYTVERAGKKFTKYCTRKPHMFGKHR